MLSACAANPKLKVCSYSSFLLFEFSKFLTRFFVSHFAFVVQFSRTVCCCPSRGSFVILSQYPHNCQELFYLFLHFFQFYFYFLHNMVRQIKTDAGKTPTPADIIRIYASDLISPAFFRATLVSTGPTISYIRVAQSTTA